MDKVVLIVDDSKVARMALKKTLAGLCPAWTTIEAANGEEARASLEAHEVDVMLIDYNMPGDNGLTVVAEIRTTFPKVSIALVTANVQDSIAERARGLGATFITKPVTVEAMRTFLFPPET